MFNDAHRGEPTGEHQGPPGLRQHETHHPPASAIMLEWRTFFRGASAGKAGMAGAWPDVKTGRPLGTTRFRLGDQGRGQRPASARKAPRKPESPPE